MSNPGDFLNPFQFNVVLSFIGFQDELKAIWGKLYIYIGNCHKHFFNFDKNILATFVELNKQQEGHLDTRLVSTSSIKLFMKKYFFKLLFVEKGSMTFI